MAVLGIVALPRCAVPPTRKRMGGQAGGQLGQCRVQCCVKRQVADPHRSAPTLARANVGAHSLAWEISRSLPVAV